MAVQVLPSSPVPQSMRIGIVSAKNTLTPAHGGDDQELLRKGTRYALTYRLNMDYVTSMDWSGLAVEGDLVRMRVHQPGFYTGAHGLPVVDGGGQAGTTLAARALTPHSVIRRGQFLNHITASGQHFLYRAKSEVVADANGEAPILLQTMLRRPPADGDRIELGDPMVEGFVRDMEDWEVDGNWTVMLQFTVRERE
ncbi:hypothetical protein [Brevundimonas sp. Root1279]|uniref:hypothetical protein n=1 Tax=Brevundimonas sp. Root1279 TaxID=1736443 RepID=UPI00071402E5|nr:hypothetical protein [Brevundimonas sp. Root1279]KQW79711.1 hypothetical protein ASC65_14275 [Brevundimonas sp. Root1279]